MKKSNRTSTYDGFKSNLQISDELEDLRKKYTPEQIEQMFSECYPKLSDDSSKKVIMNYTMTKVIVFQNHKGSSF